MFPQLVEPAVELTAPPIRWSQTAFHKLPEGPPFYELENAVLLDMPKPTIRHQEIVMELATTIMAYLRINQIGKIWAEVEVDISPTQTYVPDLSFLTHEHHHYLANGQAIVGPPDLTVEIISPSTGRRDRFVKLQIYQRAGVAWYWLVEEDLGIVEYKNSPAGYLVNQVAEPGQPFSPAIFPGLTFNLAELMGETV